MKRNQIKNGGITIGTFVKTDSPHIVEVLGTTDLDFVVIDAEHAPFDRSSIDRMMIAGRAADIPVIVRIPDMSAATIGSVLDMGAAGILVPHVDSAEQAREVVSRASYRGGSRGYSGSPRASGYGTLGMSAALKAGEGTVILCQIESPQAVDCAAEIADVPGVDSLFIGRADLALAMGVEDIRSEVVSKACARIVRVGRERRKLISMFVPHAAEAIQFAAQGVSCFVVSSDQSLMRNAAQEIADADKSPLRASNQLSA